MTSNADQDQPTLWQGKQKFTGLLAGVRVVDLSRVLAGPLCTQMMADHGADVIKVEPPFGDESRHLGPPFDQDGQATYFSALNRGKRAITLDLSTEDDQRTLFELLEHADVLIENFVPGTMEKWGLGYEDSLAARFPQLVYCSITGFGKTGPLGGQAGYDAILQAMCGLMSINGSPETGPTKIGIPIVDHLTAYTAFSGITMSLLNRALHGKAQPVEAVLFDTALSLLVPHASNWLGSGVTPKPLGSGHPNIAPYDTFTTKDGPVFLGVVNNAQFERLCRCIERHDLISTADYASNAARLKNREALHAELETTLGAWQRDILCQKLMDNKVPVAPINTVPEALTLEHAAHRNMLVRMNNYQGLGNPIKFPNILNGPILQPPKFGQHNVAIKTQLNQKTTKANK